MTLLFILGYTKSEDKIEDVLDKFEKLEEDVYTDGCRSIQPIDSAFDLKVRKEDKNGNNMSEDMEELKDSSFSSDVHIVILEENNLPDLEPASRNAQNSVSNVNLTESEEIVSIHDFTEQDSFKENDIKEMCDINTNRCVKDNVLDKKDDNCNSKCKDLDTKNTKDVEEQVKDMLASNNTRTDSSSVHQDPNIQFIEYL